MASARILLVDDYRDALAMWALYLRMLGYVVETAEDGVEALGVARVNPPDVIVMDLLLPRMNGCDAARLLRADPATAHIPIIATTGLTHPQVLREAEDVGFFAVAFKPCHPPVLLREIERALEAFPPTSAVRRDAAEAS